VGVCREGDLPAVLAEFNSSKCPSEQMEAMDNAYWPFQRQKKEKNVVWWEPTESPEEVVRMIMESEHEPDSLRVPGYIQKLEAAKDQKMLKRARLAVRRTEKDAAKMSQIGVELLPGNSLPSSATVQRRAYHSSSRRTNSSTSHDQRSQMPASAWSRPPKESQDANDNVVPSYYIERKRMRDTISERKEEEGGLMSELSAGILSDGVAAQTKVIPEKIPVEVLDADGTVRHPSGFEPPTAETEFHPVAAKVATEDDHPLLTTIKQTWDEALAPSVDLAADASATDSAVADNAGKSTSTSSSVRGFHTNAVARAIALSHMPAPFPIFAGPSIHTDAAVPEPQQNFQDISRIRDQYLPTLSQEPFWRPLLTMTFSTRPLALTIARLSRGLSRGLPFYASIDNHDRKISSSFTSRMRHLRINRMQDLASLISRKLSGEQGGILGIRFDSESSGRGVDGEGYDQPLDLAKRTVHIGVGEWYPLSSEVKEGFSLDAEAAGPLVSSATNVFGIDERGYRTDGVAWTQSSSLSLDIKISEAHLEALAIPDEVKRESMAPREKLLRVAEYCREHKMELATKGAARHAGVYYPNVPYVKEKDDELEMVLLEGGPRQQEVKI